MSLDRDDIRAAVASGILTEAQAASVIALSESRRGAREAVTAGEEPFELFKGFNEIFIVVGLVILFSGWMGLTGLAAFDRMLIEGGYIPYALATMGAVILLARYFTVKRRMVAPSIALVIFFALAAVQFGASLGFALKMEIQSRAVLTFGTATLAMLGYYMLFRVPFTMLPLAVGVFLTVGAWFVVSGSGLPDIQDIFLLSADGPFALMTVVLGLIGLAVALGFDMSDPHRVSRRSSAGFWLHVVAAPAIVNTVSITLLSSDGIGAQGLLLAFLFVMALFAIVIDRRSFLVAGVGYVVTLAVINFEGGAMLVILLLGLGLVILGAQWERLRHGLMEALPGFPGKTRLPPWGGVETPDA